MSPLLLLIELVALVWGILAFFKTNLGKKVGKYLPTPFWVYFLSILLSTFGLFPQASPLYSIIGLYGLIAALFLMLIGTPIYELFKLGPRALGAMVLGMSTMFIGVIVSYIFFAPRLPGEGAKMAGAMLGTWTGGSANLLSVKEVMGLSDKGLAPLIVADTFLSYGWLALLVMGVAYQRWFDRNTAVVEENISEGPSGNLGPTSFIDNLKNFGVIFLIAAAISLMIVILGQTLTVRLTFLSAKAWAVLLVTTGSVLLALTPFSGIEEFKASSWGTSLLYLVLATIGAKTTFALDKEVGVILAFGATALLIHGILLFSFGHYLRLPLFLLTTASQANVGGPVSAPIVAGVYRPGSAHVGVLMAILGAILGTYIGSFGGWICQHLFHWLG